MLLRLTLLIWLAASTGLAAHAEVYERPAEGHDLIGAIQHIETRAEDTFVAIARRYNVGYNELRLANPEVDPWLPGEGTPLVVPSAYVLPDAPRSGIVINLAEMRLYYYPPENGRYAGKVVTYPLGTGREGWGTPLGRTTVIGKKADPTWTPPASIKAEHAAAGDPLPDVVPAGPDNPLGQHAVYLGFPSYLLHGTNKPAGIGLRVSHGCIRLFPEDIAALFSMVSAGTPVTIVNQPYKIGWKGDALVMEAHPPDATGDNRVRSYTPWVKKLVATTRERPDTPVDWAKAQVLATAAAGIPASINEQ